ncbi:RNA-guided endonuclease InsQ/TnpB family protein [Planomonospora parontospora]|uniref:RNA-guided endonuclease InsQ/TnpB family protein n=1 Tax=Planomonospora parontospora TaxID=58119 RepID=UPI00166F7A0B|nr:RNA-guided endonuclease TnpB family protein [Planomonospora parontospora]GGL21214.1 transposase [Planomonospora parontospora subsp. antibiotica]GII15813.1 transposase [Planomonospora parontospora subsp. antibiotica]
MPRYRLSPTPAQEAALAEHCAHARFVWNLAVEQHAHWKPGRKNAPGFAEQCRQLTEARAESAWLRAGSIVVQQQALKDFAQAMANVFGGTHRRPTWRRRGRSEGFRIVALKPDQVRRLSRHVGEVKVPKVGWVRFRWSRAVPDGVKSYRITRDGAGRWHVAFTAVPQPIPAPGTGEAVGVDRGVAVAAALSTGELLTAPGLRDGEKTRLLRLQRKLARARRGSHRRAKTKAAIARLKARETDRRKDWVEKTSTDLARRFDVIAVEDLKIRNLTRSARGTIDAPGVGVRQKAGLNRSILASGWGRLVTRLEHKAPGRIVKVDPRYTSQTCNACGHRAAESRESQSRFRCVACGHRADADVNAACNIRDTAVGRTVAARGGSGSPGPANREPQLELLSV